MSRKNNNLIIKFRRFYKEHPRRFDGIMLLGIFLLSGFLRLFMISKIPPGLYADVAANGIDGLEILEGDFRILYPRNAGREAMFFYIIAIFQALFSKEYFIMYVVTAFIGILTVITLYLVVKDYKGRKIAGLSAFLLGVSFYHVHYSRLGYRTILTPLFILISFYLVRKGLQKKTIKSGVLAGFATGLGMYTYISYRTFLLALAISLVWFLLVNFKNIKKYFWFLLSGIAAYIITVVPFYIAAHQDPISAWGRSDQVLAQGSIIENIIKTFLVFGIRGDEEVQYNIIGMPVIPIILAIFFMLGLIKLLKEKGWKSFESVLIILTIGSQVGIVAITDRVPHMLRAVGITAFLFVVIAMGIKWIYEFFKKKSSKLKNFFVTIICVYLIFLPIQTFHNYFNVWANTPDLARQEFFTDHIALGEYLSEFSQGPVTIISNWYHDGVVDKDWYILQTTDYFVDQGERNYDIEFNQSISVDNKPGFYFIKSDDDVALEKFLLVHPDARLIDRIYYESDRVESYEAFRVYRID